MADPGSRYLPARSGSCINQSCSGARPAEGPLAVRHLGCGYCHRVRKTLRVHPNVALDFQDLLAWVIAFERCRISVLQALRVHDQDGWTGAAPQFQKGRVNLIF